jgi:hypothetical protein
MLPIVSFTHPHYCYCQLLVLPSIVGSAHRQFVSSPVLLIVRVLLIATVTHIASVAIALPIVKCCPPSQYTALRHSTARQRLWLALLATSMQLIADLQHCLSRLLLTFSVSHR